MNTFLLVQFIIKALDTIHDILCPFFKDPDKDQKSKQEILDRIKHLEEELQKEKSCKK